MMPPRASRFRIVAAAVSIAAGAACTTTATPAQVDANSAEITDLAAAEMAPLDAPGPADVPPALDAGQDAPAPDARDAADAPDILDAPADSPADAPADTPADVPPLACPAAIVGPAVRDFTCSFGTCGNGTRESHTSCGFCPMDLFCTWRMRNDLGSCCYETGELCDGTDLAGATCTSLGYAGGALRCAAWCGWDPSGCDTCAHDTHVASCGDAPGIDVAGLRSLAIAVRGSDLGVAWATAASAGGSAIHFARFAVPATGSPALRSNTGCFGASDYTAGQPAADLQVASTPDGWMVAAPNYDRTSGDGWADLFHLRADGTSPMRVQQLPGALWFGRMVPRAASGPVMLWMGIDRSVTPVRSVVRVLALHADGTTEWSVDAPAGTLVDRDGYDGVEVPGGVLFAARTMRGVATFVVSASGTISAPIVHDAETETPRVAWTGAEARLSWFDFGVTPPLLRWVRLDGNGHEMGVRGTVAGYSNAAPLVATATGTWMLLGGHSGGVDQATRLDVQRLDGAASASGAPFTLTHDPNTVSRWDAVAIAGGALAAWIDPTPPGRVVFARF